MVEELRKQPPVVCAGCMGEYGAYCRGTALCGGSALVWTALAQIAANRGWLTRLGLSRLLRAARSRVGSHDSIRRFSRRQSWRLGLDRANWPRTRIADRHGPCPL